jgi:pimeloyl-ACP methyl ester carboxylesterase
MVMSHPEFTLRNIETNGISLRAAVEGSGPLVIMVHGWPELWYSWRHQIHPIADAGYQVVAPDMRGYGGSDKPHEVEAYDMASLMLDVVGIIDAFDAPSAILIGHDWGAPICWNTAAMYPDRVSAIAALSVRYPKRGPASTIDLWRHLYADRFFYQLYFEDEGVAEAELEADVALALRKIYFALSGNAPKADYWLDRPREGGLLGPLRDPDPFPEWLSTDDLEYYAANFTAGGFRGPINRYRNQDRDFEMLPQMATGPIRQPSCFIAGSRDPVRHFVPGRDLYEDVGRHCLDLRFSTIIEGAGHWVQQEAPKQVTEALLEFLATLD